MTAITESFGRSAMLAVANNYKSVAEALMELIDNPFDKRRGRRLTISITIDKKHDRVTITDEGGEGMNDQGLQDWILWGEGPQHAAGDIGQYHIGGKSAAIYLAEGLEIVCRKSGEEEIWRFHDPCWGSREEALDSSPITNLPQSALRWPHQAPPPGTGFTKVTLSGLRKNRYEVGILSGRLADTYRSLIERDECTIQVNGKAVATRAIPWSSSIDIVKIPRIEVFPGVRVVGQVGAIDRDRVPDARGSRITAGVRTEFNGRKITDGEEFEHKLSGKGNLQRVYGEIEIRGRGLKPNLVKTGWSQDSDAWTALEKFMHERMQPVVTHLGRISESRPASREERKRANSARRRVQEAFRKLQSLHLPHSQNGREPSGEGTGPGGRKRPEREGTTRTEASSTRKRRPITERTPPPDDPVGRLLRRVSEIPPVILDALGAQTSRTQWRDADDGIRSIVVNTDYPLYTSLGSNEDYVFESLVRHLVDEDSASVAEARDLFDQIIWLDKGPALPAGRATQ